MNMTYSIQKRRVTMTFTAKPSEAIRTCLKRHGFRWSPAAGLWWRDRVTGAADAIQEVRQLLGMEQKPIEEPAEQGLVDVSTEPTKMIAPASADCNPAD